MLIYALWIICVCGMLYYCTAIYAVKRFSRTESMPARWSPAITVLKPLCGAEPELYENLRSFCEQDYPEFQVIFGVSDPADPSAEVARKLVGDLPERDLVLVSGDRPEGPNFKVGSLQRMMQRARHDLIVIADSDIRVGPDYLSRVIQPLADPAIGLVTCIFTGRPTANIWSRLRAMWFNHWFLPSVLFSRLIGVQKGCFGSTLVIRRAALDSIGGFAAIRDQLADDNALGVAIRKTGKQVALSGYLVKSTISETGLNSLTHSELRWGRTIRSIAPLAYIGWVICNPVALATLGAALTGFSPPALLLLGFLLVTRGWMTRTIDRTFDLPESPLWLVYARDMLSLVLYLASLWGSRVVWRRHRLRVVPGGRLVTDQPQL